MKLPQFLQGAEEGARWMVVATAFVVPLPTAWVTLSTLLFLLLWLCAGQFAQRLHTMRQHPLATLSLALLAWMALAMAWSPADWRPSLDQWWHYRELLLLPLMLSVVGKDATTAHFLDNTIPDLIFLRLTFILEKLFSFCESSRP